MWCRYQDWRIFIGTLKCRMHMLCSRYDVVKLQSYSLIYIHINNYYVVVNTFTPILEILWNPKQKQTALPNPYSKRCMFFLHPQRGVLVKSSSLVNRRPIRATIHISIRRIKIQNNRRGAIVTLNIAIWSIWHFDNSTLCVNGSTCSWR